MSRRRPEGVLGVGIVLLSIGLGVGLWLLSRGEDPIGFHGPESMSSRVQGPSASARLDPMDAESVLGLRGATEGDPRREFDGGSVITPRPWTREAPAVDERGWIEVEVRATGPLGRDDLSRRMPFRVDLVGPGAGDEPFQTMGETDGEGEARFFVPPRVLTKAREESECRLEFTPQRTGLQRRPTELSPHRNLRGVYRTLVRLQWGTTIRGRVLSVGGEGCRAQVVARRPGVNGQGSLGYDRALADGHFELHLSDVETPAWIEARCHGHGTARLGPLEPEDLSSESEFVLIQLQGPGVVRGQVLDAGGSPFAGLKLAVEHQRTGDRFQPGYTAPETLEEVEPGVGHFGLSITTDFEGRFEAAGLVPGEYHIHARHRAEPRGSLRLTETPVASDGHTRTYRFDAPTLVVHLTDPLGAPFRGECQRGYRYAFGYGEWTTEWPRTLEIFCSLEDETVSRLGPSMASHGGVPLGEGIWSFSVERGTDYVVGVRGPGQPWNPVAVRSPMDGRGLHLWFRVPEPVGEGAVEVTLRDDAGEVAEGMARVRILDPVSGRILAQRLNYRQAGGPWPIRLELPVGDYIVEGVGAHLESESDGSILAFKEHGGARAPISIRSGETTGVTLGLPPGGRVHLLVLGEADARDLDEVRRVYGRDANPDDALEGRRARFVRTVLRRGKGTPQFLEFPSTSPSRSTLRDGVRPGVLLGESASSLPVPAGTYTLTAYLPGGRLRTQAIRVLDGQTTTVVLEIE